MTDPKLYKLHCMRASYLEEKDFLSWWYLHGRIVYLEGGNYHWLRSSFPEFTEVARMGWLDEEADSKL